MNRMQIALVLGMNVLEIPVNIRNYQRICDAAYLAEQRGVYISPSRVELDVKTGHAFSPYSHEDGGNPSWNLLQDVAEIERDLATGLDYPTRRSLDDTSVKKLERLKNHPLIAKK